MTCPVCGDPLRPIDRALQCPQRHNFDQAREGYFHLLPTGHRVSRVRGDPIEMLRARARTFDRGFFEPLASTICNSIERMAATTDDALAVVDAGCGTGYYIGHLARAIYRQSADAVPAQTTPCLFGIDVSRDAVRLAARQHPAVQFLVNDLTHRLCFASSSVQILLNIFAPRNSREFARVLGPAGWLVTVIPGTQHLGELRTELPLLRSAPEKATQVVQQFRESFALLRQQQVNFRRTVTGTDISDLLGMGPNYWHLDAQQLARIRAFPERDLTFDFVILVFRKTSEMQAPIVPRDASG